MGDPPPPHSLKSPGGAASWDGGPPPGPGRGSPDGACPRPPAPRAGRESGPPGCWGGEVDPLKGFFICLGARKGLKKVLFLAFLPFWPNSGHPIPPLPHPSGRWPGPPSHHLSLLPFFSKKIETHFAFFAAAGLSDLPPPPICQLGLRHSPPGCPPPPVLLSPLASLPAVHTMHPKVSIGHSKGGLEKEGRGSERKREKKTARMDRHRNVQLWNFLWARVFIFV